jgi:hypothetical protein
MKKHVSDVATKPAVADPVDDTTIGDAGNPDKPLTADEATELKELEEILGGADTAPEDTNTNIDSDDNDDDDNPEPVL